MRTTISSKCLSGILSYNASSSCASPVGCGLALIALSGGFAFFIDHQALVRWPGSIHFSGHLRQPGAHLLNKPFRCSRETELLTVGRDFRLALLPREELVAIISKLLRTLDTDISRFQFVGQERKDTDFQMMTRKPHFAFAFHQNCPLPLLAGKGEIKRCFQVLLR